MAYPELVSRGVSKSRKFKWLVKVGACKDVNLLIKKIMAGGGGVSGQPENLPGYATGPCSLSDVTVEGSRLFGSFRRFLLRIWPGDQGWDHLS